MVTAVKNQNPKFKAFFFYTKSLCTHITKTKIILNMDGIRTPNMVWSGYLPHELMIFKQYLTLIFKVPISNLKTEERMTYVLIWMDEEGLRIYNKWTHETKTLIEFWNHLSEVLEPRSNYRQAILQLEKMKQAKDELVRVPLFSVKTCFYRSKMAKRGKNLSLPC